MSGIFRFQSLLKIRPLLLSDRGLKCSSRKISATSQRQSQVGFIGLGHMGGPMAVNLAGQGRHSLCVCDTEADAVAMVTASVADVRQCQTPAEVAEACDVIISMLPSNNNVREVYMGANGVLTKPRPGSLYLDCSTIDPSVSKEVAAVAQTKSVTFMDAPVSGGVLAAKDAQLTFMVGGDRFEEAKDFLRHMGKNVIHCGPVGTGEAAKICNNMLLAISMIGTSEAMHLGIKLGLDPRLLASILNSSSGRCWSSEVYNPCPGVLPNVPSSNNYQGGFGTALMTKDLSLALHSASLHTCSTPLGSLSLQLYKLMCNQGLGHKDFSVAFKFLCDQDEISCPQG